MTFSKVIAIDGPSGSGKSTLAKDLAKTLGILYVDTGAMFRAVAWYFRKHSITDVTDESFPAIKMNYFALPDKLISIDGVNLTEEIRRHEVSELASKISQQPPVRKFLLDFQRKLARKKVCVMEGRDIGTVVFPDAFCKIFLTAGPEVRAERRHQELLAKGETHLDMQQILSDIKTRDERDVNRIQAPLRQAEDAWALDTDHLTAEEVLLTVADMAVLRACELGISL